MSWESGRNSRDVLENTTIPIFSLSRFLALANSLAASLTSSRLDRPALPRSDMLPLSSKQKTKNGPGGTGGWGGIGTSGGSGCTGDSGGSGGIGADGGCGMTIGGDSVNRGSASKAATKQPTAATVAKITDFGIVGNGIFLKGTRSEELGVGSVGRAVTP